MNRPKAIVITNGLLDHSDAKTAHGLIRGTERFEIAGIIDFKQAGKDAGEVLDGKHRGIPVYSDLDAALAAHSDIRYCIIGVATVGGILPPDFISIIETAIRNRISVVNGLHDYLNERTNLVALAAEYGVELIDIRRLKKSRPSFLVRRNLFCYSTHYCSVRHGLCHGQKNHLPVDPTGMRCGRHSGTNDLYGTNRLVTGRPVWIHF